MPMMGSATPGGPGAPNLNMIMPHLENLQQMDQTNLDSILFSLISMVGPDVL